MWLGFLIKLIYSFSFLFSMNKKGEESTILPSGLGGLVLGSLLVLLLIYVGYTIYSALAPIFNPQEQYLGFFEFIKTVDELSQDEKKVVNLIVNAEEAIFSLEKKIVGVSFYKSLNKESEKRLISLSRPSTCNQDSSCICKCKLIVKEKEVNCEEKSVYCHNFHELQTLQNNFQFIGPSTQKIQLSKFDLVINIGEVVEGK